MEGMSAVFLSQVDTIKYFKIANMIKYHLLAISGYIANINTVPEQPDLILLCNQWCQVHFNVFLK